jgi:glycosyltransferase involved in cell wall biosynthesis
MKVLYFGVYNPSYSRNRVIRKALEAQGVTVIECRDDGPRWGQWLRLIRKHRQYQGAYDVMLVGFPGQEIMFLARWLARAPIIFDAFTSHYGGYILDRKKFGRWSLRSFWYRFLDRWSCKLADRILLDTQAHIDFFVREFGVAPKKFRRLFVGTDTSIFKPTPLPQSKEFIVHFHGNYIPLQGVEHIIEAAHILRDKPVIFHLIGKGQTYHDAVRLAEKLEVTNVRFIDPVPYSVLHEYLARADLCLGVFGNSPKTDIVIPNKVYEALATRRPVLTARTTAIKELLTEDDEVELCIPAHPENLAEKIIKLMDDRPLREKLAQRGHDAFLLKASEDVLGLELLNYARELL